MVTVSGFNVARSQEIEDASIVGASIVAGNLILERHDGGTLNAGSVQGGQPIPHSSVTTVSAPGSPVGTNSSTFNDLQTPLSVSGFQKYQAGTKLICEYSGGIYNENDLGEYEIAVNIGGVNTSLARGFGIGGGKSGIVQITGLAVATYTINLYYRRVNGVGTVYDGTPSARNCLKVTETY